MAQGTFTDNGSTEWFAVTNDNGVHITAIGTWGAGTLAIEQQIMGAAHTAINEVGEQITFTADFGAPLAFKRGDIIRLTLSGSSAPSLNWSISGNSF